MQHFDFIFIIGFIITQSPAKNNRSLPPSENCEIFRILFFIFLGGAANVNKILDLRHNLVYNIATSREETI